MYHIHITNTVDGETTDVINSDVNTYAMVAQQTDDHTVVQFMLQNKAEIMSGGVEKLIHALALKTMTAQQTIELGIKAALQYDCLELVMSYFRSKESELGYKLSIEHLQSDGVVN